MRSFTRGYRFGSGEAAAVVRPGSLVELWRALNACVEAGVIIICQASNTGLTGGSTPDGDYDRPVIIISTRRLGGIQIIRDGAQVVCMPGSTLYELERQLRPMGRAPHSEIGSSCIGASVIGGLCLGAARPGLYRACALCAGECGRAARTGQPSRHRAGRQP
jgi:D-lactate dehydrogenase